MEMNKIAVTTTTFGEYDSKPLDLCKEKGYDVILNPYGRKIKPDELIDLAKDAIGIIAGTELFSAAVLQKLPNLKSISRCGVGLDTIDMDAARKMNIKIFNTPDGPTLAVAEFTIGLMLSLLRKIPVMDRETRSGLWRKRMGGLISAKRIGIIGLGRIGKRVAELAKALGANVFYYDPFIKECRPSFPKLQLKELLEKSDIISLHLCATKENSNMIGRNELSLMKRTAFLINCSRGGIVDEGSLYEALKNRELAGAAIDVFAQEPYSGPLTELENVILTPHVGSYAKEARIQMEIQAVNNLLAGL